MSYKNKKNKQFGYLFFLIFFTIGLWPLLNSEKINLMFILISLIFLILTITNSRILIPLSTLWIKFGELLGRFIAPLVMGFVFFFILTPISLLLRLFNKDFLKLKFSKQSSYWIKRDKDIGSMKKQF
jgi:polyferredoxin